MSRQELKQAKKSYKRFTKDNNLSTLTKDYTVNQINSYNKNVKTLSISKLIK